MPDDFVEVMIDEAVVGRLVDEQFPQWAALPIARAAEFGTDNAMFRLGDALAARLPRFAARAEQVENTRMWLPVLAPHLAVAIPVPIARGRPGAGYPFDWSIVPWLSGDEATLDRVADETQFAGDVVDVLHSLWEVDAIRGPAPSLSGAWRGLPLTSSADSAAVEWRVRERIAALDGVCDVDALGSAWETFRDTEPWRHPGRWLHTDLKPANMLVTGGRLSAIIDFSPVVGDPACDVAVAWTSLSPAGRSVFRRSVDVDVETWMRGCGWGLAIALPGREQYLEDSGSRDLVDELLEEARNGGVPSSR